MSVVVRFEVLGANNLRIGVSKNLNGNEDALPFDSILYNAVN